MGMGEGPPERPGGGQARSAQVAKASAAAASMEQPVPQRITSVVKVTQAISWSEGLVMPAAVIAARAAVEKIIGPVRLMCESYTTRSA